MVLQATSLQLVASNLKHISASLAFLLTILIAQQCEECYENIKHQKWIKKYIIHSVKIHDELHSLILIMGGDCLLFGKIRYQTVQP
jgi:hypothetical protein